jgi:hypothetical protein
VPEKIFISHASGDDEFARELRVALELLKLPVWVDSRNLCGGNKLAPEIEKAIEDARQVIVVLSPNTVNFPWVRREITKALEVERRRKDEAAALEVERSQKEEASTVGTEAYAGELVAQASDWEFKLQLALPNHPQHRIPGRPIIPLIE